MDWFRRFRRSERQASQYARSLIEASLDPFVTISPEGKITDVNEATVKMTGVPRQVLIGTDFSDYFTEPENAREGYREVFEKGFVTDYPLTIRHVSGQLTHVLYNASVYKDTYGRVLGVFAAARDVTAQKRTSQYARSLIEAALDPMVTISPQGIITDVNQATVKATGVSRENLIGTDFCDYFTEPEKARTGYREVFEKGFITDFPLTIQHRDGQLTDVLYNASVYRDEQGKVLGVFAAARDVTETKRAMRDFVETKNFLDNILQSSIKYSIIGMDLERRILSWNKGAQRNYGYTTEDVVGKSANILHGPEDVASGAVDRLMATAYDDGMAEGEYQRVRKDGSRFLANVVVTRRNDPAGQPVGYLVMSSDITERKQVEEQLRYASLYGRSLIEASLDPLVTISAEGKITDVNQATEKITGVSRQALIGTDFSNYFTEPVKAREGYRKVFEKGFVTDYPLTIRHVSGKLTHVLYNASVYKDTEGKVLGVFAAARDVTAQKEAFQYARSLIEASLDPMVTISADGKITDVNEATEQATGVTRDRLIGSDFADYFTEPDKARQGYRRVLREGFVRDYPLALRHVSGKITEVIYNASLYKNPEGKVQGVFAAARDITERKELERKVQERTARLEKVLLEAQEAINVLSGSASEILTVISQLASGAAEAAASVSETTTTVEEVRQTAQLSNQKARDIAAGGKNAAKVLQAGQKNVEEAVTEMTRIRDQMASIAETIVTLSEQSQAIGEITGTVSELAERSNLLAVNAAIEAAKAGEQGKGFAVVAQEIKSLAEQSKQATTQVRGLLAEIQKAIGNAVMATEQSGKVVESGVAQSRQAGESIRVAVAATVEVARASDQIVATSQQQLSGVDQVAIAMENINRASAQNAESTKQVESVAQNLHELSQKLRALVERYQG